MESWALFGETIWYGRKVMVSGTMFMSGCASVLVMAGGKFLNLSELQTSPAQRGDDTMSMVVGGLHERWCAKP